MTGAPGLLQAFILHRRDYSNTSLLLEVFASGQGRFPAIAKGARRPRAPSSALLQPFQPLWIGVSGRGEVRTLTRVEAAGRAAPLSGLSLLCGFYVNELMIRLLARNDPHDELFAFYHAVLDGLGTDPDLGNLLRRFELRMLDALGYGLVLDVDAASGEPVSAGRVYVFEPERGPRAVSALDPGEKPGERLSGATLIALARGATLDAAQLKEARGLLQRALDPYLGGRPLKSRELLRRWSGRKTS